MKPLLCCTLLFTVPLFAASDDPKLATALALFNDRAKTAEAQQAYEDILAANPANADAALHLGWLALRRNDQQKAIDHMETAVRLAPDNAAHHQALGDAYAFAALRSGLFSKLGLARKCRAEYERAVELAPENARFHLSLFEYYRRAPGIVGGSAEKAKAEAAIVTRLDPVQGHFAMATLLGADKKYDQVLAELDEVLKLSPDHYGAHFQIGRLASLSGQHLDRGIASFNHCLALNPAPNEPTHANVSWRLGYLHEKKGDLAAARSAYETALKLDPKLKPAAESLQKLKS